MSCFRAKKKEIDKIRSCSVNKALPTARKERVVSSASSQLSGHSNRKKDTEVDDPKLDTLSMVTIYYNLGRDLLL